MSSEDRKFEGRIISNCTNLKLSVSGTLVTVKLNKTMSRYFSNLVTKNFLNSPT